MLLLAWIVIPLIISILVCLNLFLMQKKSSVSKFSIYECGFAPKFSARLPFSLRFFLLALLFLVFDVELVLVVLFPITSLASFFIVSMTIFCLFLFFGLLHEWNEGSLSWVQ